jgi:retinol dehydrogenase-12
MGIIAFLIYLPSIAFILYILRKYFNGPMCKIAQSMAGKTIIVTGANAGIGKEAALELLDKGAKVILACRDENKTMAVINSIKDPKIKENAFFLRLDVSSLSSIESFVEEFTKIFEKFDILVNNAGASFDQFQTAEGIEKTLMTNHIGPVYLTCLLLNKLNPQGKVINVSSMAYAFVKKSLLENYMKDLKFNNEDKKYKFFTSYGVTKLGNIYHAIHLDRYFRANRMELKSASCHPGWVQTEWASKFQNKIMQIIMKFVFIPLSYFGAKTAKVGAQTTVHLCYINFDFLKSGHYYNNCRIEDLNEIAKDEHLMNKFLDFTYECIAKIKPTDVIPKEVKEYFERS